MSGDIEKSPESESVNNPLLTSGSAAEAEAPPADAEAPAAEPEAVDYSGLELPEGVALDEASTGAVVEFAARHKLTREQAADAVATLAAWQKTQEDEWVKVRAGWVAESKKDKEIGGDEWEKNLGEAKALIVRFGGQEVIDALNLTGAGDHPAIHRMLVKVARQFREADVATSTPPGTSAIDKLYAEYQAKTGVK